MLHPERSFRWALGALLPGTRASEAIAWGRCILDTAAITILGWVYVCKLNHRITSLHSSINIPKLRQNL